MSQNINNNSPDSSQNDAESIKYENIGAQPQSQPHIQGGSQPAQPETWSAHLAAAQNSNTGSSSSVAGPVLTDQQLLMNQQQNRNMKISPQVQLAQQYGHQMHNNSYDDNSSGRGSPTDQQQNAMLMGPRGGNMNLKNDAMAVMGGSDAEVAQAQAQFRNQGLIGLGQMQALQASSQGPGPQHPMGAQGVHQRVRSSSNNSGLNVAPSFGAAGLASSVLGGGSSQMSVNQVDNQFHTQMMMGRNSINITNQNTSVQQQSHSKQSVLFANMGQQAYIGRNIANNSAQPMQGVSHNLVQSQPNLAEQLVYNNLGQSAQLGGGNADFNNLLASHQAAQSPDKKSKQAKRHQNHSQNNRESGHVQGARFGSQNNNGSQARNNQVPQPQATPQCQYHGKPYVAFCIIHNELVCEECCDLSHHRDHNNQILLLKAAAQNFIQNVDKKLDHMIQNRSLIANCEKFNLRYSIRNTINDFFDEMRAHIDELQRKKMNEMNKILKETNFINVQLRAKELDQRADMCEQFFAKKRLEYNQRNYVKFLMKTNDIDKIVKQSDKIIRDTNFLLKESEKQRQIQLIHEKDKAKSKLKKVIDQNLKMPLVGYNKEMLDTLHFFVYNTHNLFMYNFRSHSYRSYVVNIKIPANFMSVENEEGRIFLTGGGEPGKATKSCYEFVEERLVQRRDMLFERRAHTLTSVLVEKQKSQIFAIGSSLPPESMNKCEVYDVTTDTWTQVANLNTRRNFHTTLAFDNKSLYVVAGFNGGQRTNLIEKFDLKERNHWETLNLKIKENTNWICLEGCGLFQISNDHMIIFGGFTTSDQKTNHCYLFNVHTNEIEQLNCKTRTQSNFYQRQPKKGGDGKLYCVETNSLDLHIFNLKSFEWDFIDRKYIGW